jgi:hypothetical protein
MDKYEYHFLTSEYNIDRLTVQVRVTYQRLCESIGFNSLHISEFNEMIQTLPGTGLITLQRKGKEFYVTLSVPEADLIWALQDDPLSLNHIFSENQKI